MKEPLRCPRCGAANPPNALWCGQCLESFAPPEPPPPPIDPLDPLGSQTTEPVEEEGFDPLIDPIELVPEVAAPQMPTPADFATASVPSKSPPREAIGTKRGAFVVTEKGIVWTCSVCESINPLDAMVCASCGAPFAQTLAPEPKARPQRDPGRVALLSMVFPGAGHAYLDMWGQAIARGVVFTWVILVAILGFSSSGSGALAVIFTLAALAVWFVTAHDAYREANGAPNLVILKPKYFLWLVLGLLGVMLILMLIAGFSGTSSNDEPPLGAQGTATASIRPAGPKTDHDAPL